MDFQSVLEKRRSIRKFDTRPIPKEIVEAILEAGRRAPSGGNIQPWRYVVVEDEAVRKRLKEASPLSFFAEAPLLILACFDREAIKKMPERFAELTASDAFEDVTMDAGKVEALRAQRANEEVEKASYAVYNTAISVTHMDLTAVAHGLGTCWIGMFDKEKVREILGIDARFGIVCALQIGYALQSPPPRPRLSMDDIVLQRF